MAACFIQNETGVLFAPRVQLSGLIYLRVYKSGSWCQILHQGTRDKKRLARIWVMICSRRCDVSGRAVGSHKLRQGIKHRGS
jgi:hypothetical protein